jgi:hypothetical protein
MPQLPAGVFYGVSALLAGQIVLGLAEQILAEGGGPASPRDSWARRPFSRGSRCWPASHS